VALIFLIGGILWQTGIIDLNKYFIQQKAPPPPEEKVSPVSSIVETTKPMQPETPQAVPVTAPFPPASVIHYPYSIVTGSFRELERANKAISFHKEKDQAPSYWSYVDLGEKGKWYRVCVGLFETPEEAQEFKEGLDLPGTRVLETAYTTEIGYYSSEDEMMEKAMSFKETGYVPYSIEYPQKGYRLLIGAYVTREGADEMVRVLKELGIESKAVLR
jgi:cell division septation protein DedD